MASCVPQKSESKAGILSENKRVRTLWMGVYFGKKFFLICVFSFAWTKHNPNQFSISEYGLKQQINFQFQITITNQFSISNYETK
jgi:hypothetical protein